MIIDQSTISLSAQRSYSQSRSVQESLQISSTAAGLRSTDRSAAGSVSDRVNLSHPRLKAGRIDPGQPPLEGEERLTADFNIRLLKELFERMTGRKFQLTSPWGDTSASQEPETSPRDTGDAALGRGFSLIYRYEESTVEAENTVFNGSGLVTTADGRNLKVEISLAMSREFVSRNSFEFRAGEALKDPLVINFGGNASQLTATKFAFDIDSDGFADQISFVGEGSGFLALDKNSDGRVTDGSELFGASSGDGFADLRAYDRDGNNWLDERDAIYHQLRIWLKDAEGRDQLLALGQVGVGALYLGSVSSEFAIKDSDNQLLGQVRQSGLALLESGQAVSIQQIDLAV